MGSNEQASKRKWKSTDEFPDIVCAQLNFLRYLSLFLVGSRRNWALKLSAIFKVVFPLNNFQVDKSRCVIAVFKMAHINNQLVDQSICFHSLCTWYVYVFISHHLSGGGAGTRWQNKFIYSCKFFSSNNKIDLQFEQSCYPS